MNILTCPLLEGTGLVRLAMSTREGGASVPPLGMNLSFRVGDDPACVEENRRRLLSAIDAPADRLALPGQVHGSCVRRVERPGLYADCDALVTDVPGLVLGVTIADCVPLLLLDPERPAVAAVHAGWRGTAANIAAAAVSAMHAEYGSGAVALYCWIGPGAAACCYEVGEEVAARFPPEAVERRNGKPYLDIRTVLRSQLLAAGVMAARIAVSPHCTIHETTLFHSFRRDGERSGRMMCVIRLVGTPVR